MRRKLLQIAAAAAMLAGAAALTACSGSSTATRSTAPAAPASLAQTSPAARVQTEGSVTTRDGSFVKYPNGAVVRLVKVEHERPDECVGITKGHVCIIAEATLTNTGTAPLVFDIHGGAQLEMFYGVNRAASPPGAVLQQDGQIVTFPRRCMPGTTVAVANSFAIPASEMDSLALQFEGFLASGKKIGPYLFTDVQALLH